MLKNCKKGRQNSILLRNCNGKNDEFRFDFLFLGYISYCWRRMLEQIRVVVVCTCWRKNEKNQSHWIINRSVPYDSIYICSPRP